MKNAVDYCVNVTLTVSYDRPVSRIHTHTHHDYFSYTRTHARTHERTRGRRLHNQDSSAGTLTMLGAGRPEARFLLKNVQIGSGTHSASYAMGTGFLSG
jgi:hypothetical protein